MLKIIEVSESSVELASIQSITLTLQGLFQVLNEAPALFG